MPENPNTTRPGCPQAPHAELFETMAEQLHVDLEQASHRGSDTAIARARARCRNCTAVEECEGWLNASFGVPLPPSFCPNAPFFHLCIAAAHDKSFDPA